MIKFRRVAFNFPEQFESLVAMMSRQLKIDIVGTPAQFGNDLPAVSFFFRAVKLQPVFRRVPVVAMVPVDERRAVSALPRRQFVVEVFGTPFQLTVDDPTPQFGHGRDFAASVFFFKRIYQRLSNTR